MSNRAGEDTAQVESQYPTVQSQLYEAEGTQLARVTCPHCGHEDAYGLPYDVVDFGVGCANCERPFMIQCPPEYAGGGRL